MAKPILPDPTNPGWFPIPIKIFKVDYLQQISNLIFGDQSKIKHVQFSNRSSVIKNLGQILVQIVRLKMKTTFNERWAQNIKSGISNQPLFGSCSNCRPKLVAKPTFRNDSNEDDNQGKTTTNMKKDVFQQPLIGFCSNFSHKQKGPT